MALPAVFATFSAIMFCRIARLGQLLFALTLGGLLAAISASGQSFPIRDGGINPANLGKGDWIYFMNAATNKLGGNVASVTNENSLMLYYKSQGIRYFIVKAATSDYLFNGAYTFPQFNSNLVNIAHAHGLLIFGYNRSYGSNVLGEIAISDYVFRQGADGFVWDAEAEWESNQPWIGSQGPEKAWQLCSTVRSNWPTKFLAHAPFPIIYLHSSFPYKEFGYWSDTVMPQIYHFSSSGLRRSPSAMINWSDVNWDYWQKSLAGSSSVINGATIYWTNAIKPLAPIQDVYGPLYSSPNPNKDVMEFIDYLTADPNCPAVGGYKGVNFWRTDLHGATQWSHIKAATSGDFPGLVSNIVLDDAGTTGAGAWTVVPTFNITNRTAPGYIGVTGSDTNSFGTNYWVKGPGNGSAWRQFTPDILTSGSYDVYQWHPYRADASTNVPFAINHLLGTTTVFANQQTNSGNWSKLGRFDFGTGTSGTIRVLDSFSEAGAVALVDGLKLVYVGSTTNTQVPTVLFDVAATAGGSAAIISWNSTNPCTTQVEYGLTTNLGLATYEDATPVTSHVLMLADLLPRTNYFFTVVSRAGTNVYRSGGWSFSTVPDVILDNGVATYSGSWTSGTSAADKYGADYRYASAVTNTTTASALYYPNVTVKAGYDVSLWYPQGGNRTTNALINIIYGGGNLATRVNQQTNGGRWVPVGTNLTFRPGQFDGVRISNFTGETSGVVMADAVRLSYNLAQDKPVDPTTPDWWTQFYFGASVSPLLDSDGDGIPNWAEYQAGTAPNSPASRLNFRLDAVNPAMLQATFSPYQSDRLYQLERCTNFGAGWQILSNAVPAALGNGSASFSLPNGPEPLNFYRLKISWAP